MGSADALRLAGQMRCRSDPFGWFQPRRAPRLPGADFGIRAPFTGDRPLVPRSGQGHRRPRPAFRDGRDVLQVPLPRTGQFPGHRFEPTMPVVQPAMTIADIPDEAYTLMPRPMVRTSLGRSGLRLSEGRLGRTVIDSPFFAPIGPLADLAGAETVWRTGVIDVLFAMAHDASVNTSTSFGAVYSPQTSRSSRSNLCLSLEHSQSCIGLWCPVSGVPTA